MMKNVMEFSIIVMHVMIVEALLGGYRIELGASVEASIAPGFCTGENEKE